MADKIPKLGSSVKGISEVYDMIKNPEYVRPTTRIANLQRAIDRGTPSGVVRSAGYNKLFQTFLKNGISSATVNKFKLIPDIANFDSAKAYSEALKKFRNTAFEGLSNAQLRVIQSSGFLSQYAKDQRIKLLKSGMKNIQPNLNKILDKMYDFTFMTKESAVGVKKPKLQSKIYTQIRDMAKSTLNKAQRLNLDYALSQVDDLFKSGNAAKAAKMLAGISTLVAKGAFAVGTKVLGPLDLLIDASPSPRGTGELPPEVFAKMMEEAQTREVKKDNMQKAMNKNKGGMMNINHMTRPLGYHKGGAIKLGPGQALYDKDGNEFKLNPGQALYDAEGNLIMESPGERLEDIERKYGLTAGQLTDYEQGLLKLSPGQTAYDAEGNVVTEDQLPYDPDKGYTENLNELMTDIGGTIKEKVKGAGKSLLDKINDFLKYGHGDREDYMEIGGEQMDPDDPNFKRFIENNYMGEGESYIEGIENYKQEVEGESYRRGGIVSLNHMIRPL